MCTLGIITARSGSKGIRDKNIKKLSGKPLMAYTIESALKCKYIDKVMVSTDSDIYADIARGYGAEVPFFRSGQNSTDVAASIDVLLEAFQLFYEKKADSVVSVCECEHSPLLSNVLPDDLNMYGFIRDENNLRRQELRTYYRLNGAIYISRTDKFKQIKSFYGEKSYAYIMQQGGSVDIDTELDFAYAEFLLNLENRRV